MRRIEVRNLTKYYGERLVLHGVNMGVDEHEVVVLIGPSGSGKSTLLRCINRLVPFDYGDILLDGVSISDPSLGGNELPKRVGIVFQSYNLFPHLNVLDNVTLAPRRVHGVDRAEAEERAMDVLGRFAVADLAKQYPDKLSSGQQQRVAIARALVTDPEVLLLDEITAALDPEIVGDVLSVIRELKEQGLTMVIVTHEMGFARDVADRVYFLDQARIVEEGPPEQVFGHPEHPRTRQFLQRIIEAGRL
ncbi:MAG: amino acid ABC transporter ATP-binding protein [Actinomycetes bacterium]|jgi:polar amino acid transport system ATP-binding protein|nr:MAG: peptide ABC transporter ATP-binding protein [Actinomycetota bacterium]